MVEVKGVLRIITTVKWCIGSKVPRIIVFLQMEMNFTFQPLSSLGKQILVKNFHATVHVELFSLPNIMLPYFAQLAKVFSQGKYYVGGPRKVQNCLNCLLTNTLIMRFCLFIVVIN
jgi:hypothetical protein